MAATLASAERRESARALVAPFQAEYPFEGSWLEVPAGGLHYLDEGPGDAPPLLCVHGNPTWSFFFRRLVRELREEHRLVVPDHIGCGLSDKPQDWSYDLRGHVDNLERLVLELDLRDITLVLHDWGGAIGMGLAVRHPERIARLVVMNTAAFPAERIPFRINICRTPVLGELAIRGLGAFARSAVYMAVAKHDRMTSPIKRGYLAPYRSYAERIANWRFVKDIPMSPAHPSYALLEEIGEGLGAFRALPMLVLWGERDFCFSPHFRRMWQERFPAAEVHAIPDAGHYLLEDAHEEILPWLRDFLQRHPSA